MITAKRLTLSLMALAVQCSLSIVLSSPATAGDSAPSWLKASGDKIVNSDNEAVVLHGVNLGGWLVEEPWMEPFTTAMPMGSAPGTQVIVDHVSLWGTAKRRFGDAGMVRLRNAFRSSWIDETDFDRIHADGLNCVRLPFLASLLDEPGGIHWLDQAVSWASVRGIYVILDMHGAPGSQSGEAHTGQKGLNSFFRNPSNIALAEDDWRRIADHFKDNPAVAGYDLLNEPTGTPNSDTLYVVQDGLYRAIRGVDRRHIIFMEDGYTGIQWMPFPAPAGWQNIVYSTHYYNFNAKSELDQRTSFDSYISSMEQERTRRNIPYYVGEFGFEPGGTATTLSYATKKMSDEGLAWTMWTYKVMWVNGGESLWSFYSNAKPITPLNFYTDSLTQLVAKCAEVKTAKLDANPHVLQPMLELSSTNYRRASSK